MSCTNARKIIYNRLLKSHYIWYQSQWNIKQCLKLRLVGSSLRRIGLSMQQQAIKASAPAP